MSERDPFKARLRRRDVMFGCFVGQPSPAIVEMVGYAGFDYVIIDLEHGPSGLETLENMLRAAQAAGTAALVRLPSPAQADVLRVLDAGADGILVPHVEDVAGAQAVIAHAYYPPAGQRGISTVSRAARHAIVSPQAHLSGANARTAVMLMIESRGAVEQLDLIIALDGIDGIFVGPNDLASALGHVGNRDHPDVQATICDIVQRAQQRGCALATLARSLTDVTDVPRRGFTMVTFNTTFILAQGLREIMAARTPS
jgi:4-hydroxy-2-oxoheptanedioate aldolase